jgi:hypothetical protein
MKYKVGDRVLILETITGIDEDSDYPYIITSDDGQDEWVYREDEILAVVNPDAFAEEAKPTLKYKVDEFVTDSENMDYGIGKIIEVDENNEYQYHVEFFYINDYCPMKVWKWLKEEKVNPITVHDLVAECNKIAELHNLTKEHKITRGDQVVHRNTHRMGNVISESYGEQFKNYCVNFGDRSTWVAEKDLEWSPNPHGKISESK